MPTVILKDKGIIWKFNIVALILQVMHTIVTVFKTEFGGQDNILKKAKLIAETKDIGEAFIFIPLPGKLFELLNLFKDSAINYGTHFKAE